MRSYGQYCAAAKALDVIGDRWNLLIVRELLIQGGCRYTDLLNGLPGIATNLLADRLRDLEAAGVLYRENPRPPVATTVFRLTPKGERLRPVLLELVRWGADLMGDPDGEEAFRSHWLSVPVDMFLEDHAPDQPKITLELRPGDEEPLAVEADGGRISTRLGGAADPDLILAGPPPLILGVLARRVELADARNRGLRWHGDLQALERVRPVDSATR